MSTVVSDTIKKEEIFDRIQQSIWKFFKCPNQIVTYETVAFDINGWDSLAHSAFMLELEECFGIGFSVKEVLEFENISTIVDAVYSHLINGSLPHIDGLPQLTRKLHNFSLESRALIFEFNRSHTIETVANNGLWEELDKDGFSAVEDRGVSITSTNNFVDLPCQCNPKDQLHILIKLGQQPDAPSAAIGFKLFINDKECAIESSDEIGTLTFSFKARDYLGINALEGKNIFRLQFRPVEGNRIPCSADQFDTFILENITVNCSPWADIVKIQIGDHSCFGENLWGSIWRVPGSWSQPLVTINNTIRDAEGVGESCVKMHAIGDSHAAFNFAVYPECKIHHLGGWSIFYLIKTRFDLGDYVISSGQKVMFCFGEVDCRTIIGSLANRIPPQEFVEYLADEYLKTINAICGPKDADAAIVLPPPPFPINFTTNKLMPVVGSISERVEYTRILCSALRDLKGKGSVTGIIDAYSPYVSSIGVLDRFFTSDGYHLRPDRTDPLFAQAMEWIAD